MTEITADIVRQLIDSQFPQWSAFEIKPVKNGGHDNRTFHLGDDMTVRLPSRENYAAAVKKEITWLPVLQKHISLPITKPLAEGKPTDYYPFPWSVNKWIEGEPVNYNNLNDLCQFAKDLADFLKELESAPAVGGVPAGIQNFHRGGDLSIYEGQARESMNSVSELYDTKLLTEIWELSVSTKYDKTLVWVHGDIAVGNLLAKNGKLCAVIDFGTMGTGDPSSDLVIAWNFLDAKSRAVFFDEMNFDRGTINRARGWCLWKALISYDRNDKDSELAKWGRKALDRIVEEYVG